MPAFPTPDTKVSPGRVTINLAAAPATTVKVPESVAGKAPEATRIAAVPGWCPVKTALLPSPAATRSPSATPPVLLTSVHESAATLATKLVNWSRTMA